jgi:hypothetical protein
VVAALAVAVLLAVGCGQPDTPPDATDSRSSPAAAGPVDTRSLEDCLPSLSASVRGVTGTFPTPEDAGRSVEALPDGGSLQTLERSDDVVVFGWLTEAGLVYVIDTYREGNGCAVGSYDECLRPFFSVLAPW